MRVSLTTQNLCYLAQISHDENSIHAIRKTSLRGFLLSLFETSDWFKNTYQILKLSSSTTHVYVRQKDIQKHTTLFENTFSTPKPNLENIQQLHQILITQKTLHKMNTDEEKIESATQTIPILLEMIEQILSLTMISNTYDNEICSLLQSDTDHKTDPKKALRTLTHDFLKAHLPSKYSKPTSLCVWHGTCHQILDFVFELTLKTPALRTMAIKKYELFTQTLLYKEQTRQHCLTENERAEKKECLTLLAEFTNDYQVADSQISDAF